MLTWGDELVVYCLECWRRELGQDE